MVKLFKIHKLSGLAAGALLLLLAVTGLFLDHDKWQFLYSTTFTYTPEPLEEWNNRLFEGYHYDPENSGRIIACSKRGIFESPDNGLSFERRFDGICLGLRSDKERLVAATNDGIYSLENGEFRPFALRGAYVNALSIYNDRIFAAVDKHTLYLIDADDGKVLKVSTSELDKNDLKAPVTLSRFVRDLHYGRGYFDGDISLYINDYAAVILAWLGLGGYIIWWKIGQKRGAKTIRALIKSHANIFTVAAAAPLLVLLVTGIFLDHSSSLAGFMRSVKVPSVLLPPVYGSLRHDIWSVDFDGNMFRIGNRYGVFKSDDLKEWKLENRGFAYRMIRKGQKLFVSGMGAPNRLFENGEWKILPKSPHMFKDLYFKDGKVHYFSTRNTKEPLPKFEDITLYSLLLALHDGTFFASWWVWLNDAAAIALLLLLFTGILRWRARKRPKRPI
ncbi:hypothetical protein NNO_1582 [Hydrogenimonas sp.]|nr:hypothetical protein NNO_1582 [Hydrogenimonas sp.]